MHCDLGRVGLGHSSMVIAALVLVAGCAPSTNPSKSPASAATIGASPSTTLGASESRSHSPGASESSIDLAMLTGRIVFDNYEDVWSINADGTGLTRLTQSSWPEFDATWSPDGTRIAFRSQRDGDPEIWLMNADGSEPHRLARGLSPAWSPDGSKIAYASAGGSCVRLARDPNAQDSRS